MNKKLIMEMESVYRDNFRITGVEFGSGEKSACIVGSFRGNEIQQLYCCSQLIKKLKNLEEDNKIKSGKSILVIPCVNSYSINIGKRFWPTDNTDINRMFPGYNLGETTQRIADGVFQVVKEYKHGIQFASFYITGDFSPHVRMMHTGYENIDLAQKFGLPYIVLRKPRPYDSTTLNYNWQIWETNAFSVYTSNTQTTNEDSMELTTNSVLRFLGSQNIVEYSDDNAVKSHVVETQKLVTISAPRAGIFKPVKNISQKVKKGDILAYIIDPYTGESAHCVTSTTDGTIFFIQNQPVIYTNTTLFSVIEKNIEDVFTSIPNSSNE